MSNDFYGRYFKWKKIKNNIVISDFIKNKDFLFIVVIVTLSILITIEISQLRFLPPMSSDFMIEVIVFNVILSVIGLILIYFLLPLFFFFFRRILWLFGIYIEYKIIELLDLDFGKYYLSYLFLYIEIFMIIKLLYKIIYKMLLKVNDKLKTKLEKEEFKILLTSYFWVFLFMLIFSNFNLFLLMCMIILMIMIYTLYEINKTKKSLALLLIAFLIWFFLIFFIAQYFELGLRYMKIGNYVSTLYINNKNKYCDFLKSNYNIMYENKNFCKLEKAKVIFNLSINYYLKSNKSNQMIIIPRKYIISEIIK
ncbi:hypothetical protein FE773_07215 [Caminibacter mediatlanticus TB-2]|uniref:Uncharacterized protein n=1 Tax=Caminibacter mediatlanticus TB-2 TaxID=391592 RepID=A0ABX5VD65_9BACT|nr:hypothetical protein [Caminibacter mediatlanticus]QCT94986.1 hypothetical protein FE773_07215 [Caminibacter mediatlanticus TB-2]